MARAEVADLVRGLLKAGRVPQGTDVPPHQAPQLAANGSRPLRTRRSVHDFGDSAPLVLQLRVDRPRGSRPLLRRRQTGSLAEDQGFQEPVAPESVGAVDARGGASSRRVEPRHARGSVPTDVDAAHRAVRHRPHRNRFLGGVDSGLRLDDVTGQRKLALHLVAFEVPEIEGDELGTSAHDFFFRGSRHDVARRSLAEGRCILQRESLPAAVDQVPSQPQERLRQDHPASPDPERMKLDHLHVHQRGARSVRERHAISGDSIGRPRGLVDAGASAGREHHGVRRKGFDRARGELDRDDADTRPVVEEQSRHHPLLVGANARLQDLLVEHLKGRMARHVVDEARTRASGSAQASGIETAVRVPVERDPPMVQRDHCARRRPGQKLDDVLVTQVVTALDGVHRVEIRAVLGV